MFIRTCRNTGILFLFFSFMLIASNDDIQADQRKRYVNAFLSKDTNTVVSHFSDESRLLIQSNATIKSKENIALYFESLYAEISPLNYQRSPFHFLKLKNKTIELGNYHLNYLGKENVERSIDGSYLTIWRQSIDGKNEIEAELWNFDHQVDFAAELKFPSVPTSITAFEAHLPIKSPATMELAAYSGLIKDAVLLRDPIVLTNLYAENSFILRNSNKAIMGIEAIDKYWQTHVNEIASMEGLQQRTTDFEEIDNFIIQYSSHIAVWRSGEYSGVNTGKHIRIWERQSDGRIKIRILASAYD